MSSIMRDGETYFSSVADAAEASDLSRRQVREAIKTGAYIGRHWFRWTTSAERGAQRRPTLQQRKAGAACR